MALSSETRKLIRSIIKQVHPDLFPANPFERQTNAESLKVLNVYVDQLSSNRSPRPARVEFYIKQSSPTSPSSSVFKEGLTRIEARLTASGSLTPLFLAFGLITPEQAARQQQLGVRFDGDGPGGDASDTNFLHWLKEQVAEAVRTAEQHELLKWHIRRLKSNLEEAHSLAGVQVGAEYAASIVEQERQVEVLKVLEQALVALKAQGKDFEGISMHLYHPNLCPKESASFIDEHGQYTMRVQYMSAHIADDGCIHVVADRSTITHQLMEVDIERARTLTRVAYFWVRRAREVTAAVTDLLGVRSVWCDTKTEQTTQKFVLWAGYLLENRADIAAALGGRRFSFSVIVHTDNQAPLISFHQSSPILNVSADCPPTHLLEFLVSEAGGTASTAASEVHVSRAREEALLENVRQVLEAKCVIKICMNDKVIEGAQRLLDNADVIRRSVDLRGACIALDDCYEVWDSGFISIPYNFSIQDLPAMVRMLQAGQRPSANGSSNGNGNGNGSGASEGGRAAQRPVAAGCSGRAAAPAAPGSSCGLDTWQGPLEAGFMGGGRGRVAAPAPPLRGGVRRWRLLSPAAGVRPLGVARVQGGRRAAACVSALKLL